MSSEQEEFTGGICWPCVCCNKCGRMTDKFKCPACQAELEPGSAVCSVCGAPAPPPPGSSAQSGFSAPTAPPPPPVKGTR